MIFAIQQMSEKAVEYQTKEIFIFVDLRKAYNMIQWVLGKLGEPKVLINAVKFFNKNKTVLIRLDQSM